MVLAGGNDQIALINELRRYFDNDVYIILVDMSSDVKAIPFADKFCKLAQWIEKLFSKQRKKKE